MQRLAIIFSLVLFSVFATAQNDASIPKIRDIINKFYSVYNTEGLSYHRVSFEKRKEGWFVVTQRVSDQKLVAESRNLFYSNKTKSYLPLTIDKNPVIKTTKAEDFLDEYDLRNYDAQYYYGYKGWYKDVITEFEARKQLSEDELNALARAYSLYAGGLVSGQSGDIPDNEVWSLPLSMNALSTVQIDSFNLLIGKAQQNFKKLAQRNPDFETIVGKIGMKYANEVMFQYTILLAHANEYAKKIKLPADLYTDSQLEGPNKLLEDCPKGAILLSFGDNDYYPVHYLQQVRGIRKDVYLVNYSLLGLSRYIYQATNPQYNAAPVKLSADPALFSEGRNEIVYFRDSSYAIPFNVFLTKLRSADPEQTVVSADRIIIPGVAGLDILFPLSKQQYLFKNQWVLLDILNNLAGRKMCFPNDFIDELAGLNAYLIEEKGLLVFAN